MKSMKKLLSMFFSNNLFQQEKLQKKKLFTPRPEKHDIKNYQIVKKKKSPITVFASLSLRLKQFFSQIQIIIINCSE
jgi:hypothetical protein